MEGRSLSVGDDARVAKAYDGWKAARDALSVAIRDALAEVIPAVAECGEKIQISTRFLYRGKVGWAFDPKATLGAVGVSKARAVIKPLSFAEMKAAALAAKAKPAKVAKGK